MSRKHYDWKIGAPIPELGAHSRAKHAIFEQYVEIYIDRVTRSPGQTMLNLTLVDGFCGGGIYRDGNGTAEGSPLRLIHAIERAEAALNAARIKGFKIHVDFFFVDENPKHIAFLKDLLTKRDYGSRIGQDIFLICSNFEDAFPNICDFITRKGRAHRSLFFLDQYGWSDVRLATIRKILTSLNNPEILLTFAVDALINFLSEKTPENRALLSIELDREDVRELIGMRNQAGWRYLIQNGLYRHVQARTGANFYTPFFIHSTESHRSYWLIHLANHHKAHDEMGKLHWRLNNHFQHHGGAGFHALGFDPSRDLRQGLMPFMFDDDALKRSQDAVLKQLPRLIHAADRHDGIAVKDLFAGHCNDTPVTSDILNGQLLFLRREGELSIISAEGIAKPRSQTIGWEDRIILPRQRSLFGSLSIP